MKPRASGMKSNATRVTENTCSKTSYPLEFLAMQDGRMYAVTSKVQQYQLLIIER